VQGNINPFKNKVCARLIKRISARHAVLLVLIISLCVLIISTIGLTPDSGGLPKVTRLLPVFAPRSPEVIVPIEEALTAPIANGRLIAIDPGHGGVDPGTFYEDIHEDDINFSIALLVREYLEELGYQALLTREDEDTVSIDERVKIAEDNNADILVSIHQNALDDDTVTSGIETWYNKNKNEFSKLLAECIQDETIAATGARDRGLRPDRSLIITRKADMPSCLIETGFITSTVERANLISEDYQKKIAYGIVAGIDKFFQSLDSEG